MASKKLTPREVVGSSAAHFQELNQMTDAGVLYVEEDTGRMVLGDGIRHYNEIPSNVLSTDDSRFLSYWRYDEPTRRLVSDKAIETTLNSLYLGEQHKMSSGSENIYFTNLSSDINFFPMWGGLKDQSISVNRDASGFIPPSGRVYTDMFSLPLGGSPNALTATGYAGNNYFGVNISGLGITTVAAEAVGPEIRLEYRITISGKQVYMQELPRAAARSSAGANIYPGDTIEWFFDHPVDVRAGTTLFAEIHKVRNSDDADLGIFQVRQGDTVDPNTGLLRYQATVHNRLFEDKDLELISPHLKYKTMDFSVDTTGGSILLKDLSKASDEQLLIPHNINTLQAVANGTEIQIKIKNGAKVIIESLPVSGASINGSAVNAVLNTAVAELNALFTNALSFNSQGNPVTGVVLSGNNLVTTLQDGTSYTVDVTSLGVDTNNFVVSGAVSGTDIILTMSDSSTVTIDAQNMINGSTLSATNDGWFFAFGTNANQAVGNSVSSLSAGIAGQAPFYFGTAIARGYEFKWNANNNKGYVLGLWDGAEAVAGTYNSRVPGNWSTCFNYYNGGYVAGSNTALTNTTATGKYVTTANAPVVIRFLDDGHLVLVDLSVTPEVEIAKTINPIVETSFQMLLGCEEEFVFPNAIVQDTNNIWEIVHDFDNSEAGILNGIEDHTVLKSIMSISPGEKITFMLDEVGQGDFFGTNYTASSSGVLTAEEQLDNQLKYETNEALSFEIGGASDWNVNTNATHYFNNGAGVIGYREGGAGTVQGLFSLRYLADNTITIFSEDNNEKVATAKVDGDGSPMHLYFAVRGNRAYYSIPVISKQVLGQGSQPELTFAPDVSDQSFNIEEGLPFNVQIALDANSDIVNMYGETDAPSWAVLSQTAGNLIGTAPAYTGSSDAYVINCKAANAIGGVTNFTVTLNVTDYTATNTKSLKFTNNSSSFLSANPANALTLARGVAGGIGAAEAWTISMWVKPANIANLQNLLWYGTSNVSSGSYLQMYQFSGGNFGFTIGEVGNQLRYYGVNLFPVNQWNHVLISYTGGPTSTTDTANISITLNGGFGWTQVNHSGSGWIGNLMGNGIFRIGKGPTLNADPLRDGIINQIGIWDSDQYANRAAIYNGGATQDLSTLATPPVHYWEAQDSITTIEDQIGNADFGAYNFAASDLVTDAP